MVVNDNAGSLVLRGALESIASRLAPTGSGEAFRRYRPAAEVFTARPQPPGKHGSPWRGPLRSTRRAPGPRPCDAGR
ncbi:hypothetical protein DKY63_24890 [Pseudomonas putida]|uniref:Uncharacterized protein n=1 Tax=Pseudomonas putida TaxID=303 RepID=A0A2Z4RPC9_PSEPU|nr:hypothetical protein DKY63_24890 [Pseudomonas putida]